MERLSNDYTENLYHGNDILSDKGCIKKKKRSQSSENFGNVYHKQNLYVENNIKSSWELRNNSIGVAGILCPDYFSNNPRYKSSVVHDMISSGKILIKSKKCSKEQQSKNIERQPVKECYCYPEVRKVQLRSLRTQYRPVLTHNHCKSDLEIRATPVRETNENHALSSPISCETLRRIRKIDYIPKSQFLKNVQNNISTVQDVSCGDCLKTCPRSKCYHKLISDNDIQNATLDNQSKNVNVQNSKSSKSKKSTSTSSFSTNSITDEEEKYFEQAVINKSNKGIQVSPQKISKPKIVVKKTTLPWNQVPDSRKEKVNLKSPVKPKRLVRLLNEDCSYCCKNKSQNLTKDNIDKHIRRSTYSKHCPLNGWCSKCSGQSEYEIRSTSDKEVKDLKKFRDQNYFDTHGSSQTLFTSKSSGSLEQYLLNERLFPEPVKRIHRKDLVVTMPECATIQKKRIHYFPRYIVHQEKNVSNSSYKRKRCQSCPLTGHAIDLGILKTRPPLNSLALKYQKRVP